MLWIQEIKTQPAVEAIVAMAREHPAPEYDCAFEHYAETLRKVLYADHVKAWILWDEDQAAGYAIGVRSNDLVNQINVFDIYLKPEYRGSKNILYLTGKLKAWAEEEKALRIVWTSRWPVGAWSKLLDAHVAGVKIGQYHTYVWEVV